MAECKGLLTFDVSEADRITANMPSIINTDEIDIKVDWDNLLYLKRKEIRLFLHATALTDYVRASKIPRGLRIQKAPGIFQEDEEFKIKWASILNQCSRDLMLLIIDRSKQEVTKIKEEISKVQSVFQSQYDQEGFDKKIQEIEASLKEFERKTKDIKVKKYHR